MARMIESMVHALRSIAGAALLLLFAGALALAQQAQTPPEGSQTQPTARQVIDTGRLDLNQIEAALQRDNLDDKRLAELRQRLEPIGAAIADIIGREGPRVDEIKARIEQLGPAPDASKGQTESEGVARDRAEQQRFFREADELLRLARAQSLRIDQVGQAIADRRRANFAREILAQHASILSPWLWLDLARASPADVRAFQFLATQWATTIVGNLDWYEALLILALVALGLLLRPRARQWVESGSFHRETGEEAPDVAPTRFAKLLLALRKIALNAVLPGLILSLLYLVVERFGILPGRAASVFEQTLTSFALFAFMSGLAGAVLAPARPKWRILELDDVKALAFFRMIQKGALIVAIGRVLDSLNSAIVASLPLTLATRGLIALLVALVLAQGMRRAFGNRDGEDNEATSGDEKGLSLLPVRLAGWGAVLAIFGAAVLGFIPLATFLTAQLVWLTALGLIGVVALALIDEGIGAGLAADGLLGRRLRSATGLKASSLDQVSVLGSGAARLMLLLALAMLALAPWGVDSSNMLGNLRAAFFGFQVGGVTISLATIVLAILLFAVGYAVTRAIQNWLDTRYLPQTTLDPGLRNSIRTIFGYVGIVLAAGFALSQLGLSLDKLTIVAGALSVGIGFGLQSIVNNFVSGLILLWERPIRVGDWVVVGDEQGTVKRINVRSTEIVTFDRASLIIPNSEFISGRVKNWVHADRTARIIIPVNVEYESDPEKVEQVLLDAANAHREVLSEPKAVVIFKNLGESGLDFELRCFVDVDAMASTRSELLFDIFRRLKAAGLTVPYPTRRLEISNLPPMIDPRVLAEAGWMAEAGERSVSADKTRKG